MALRGPVEPLGDKSISHRLVLFSLIGLGRIRLENLSPSLDVASSLALVERLGVAIDSDGPCPVLTGPDQRPEAVGERQPIRLDCGNSGTTIRLALGLLAGRPGRYILDGDASLRARPMDRVAEPLRRMGADIRTSQGTCPVTITGRPLKGIDFELPVASAQLKSALLLAGLAAEGQTRIIEPVPSRDHTERLLMGMGAKLRGPAPIWQVEKSGLTLPSEYRVPGDVSSAAFFLCAAALMPGSRVEAKGVLLNPTRTGFIEVLRRMGADIRVSLEQREPEPTGSITVGHGPELKACLIRAEEIPSLVDEVPILALAASQARGRTVFEEVGELRFKETDRLAAVAAQLGAMGAKVDLEENRMIITGPTPLSCPARLDSYGDHRMAMTLRLAAELAGSDPDIAAEECAAVSYPAFLEDLERLKQ